MKIKSARSFRFWYKTKIKEIEKNDPTYNENFIGTYHKENGKKTIKGFFEMYHGDKPDIASYLPSILKIAEDGQAIYEFLQNAVDSGSTHFYIFYNEQYFLAINNGNPFEVEGLQSILNIAQTTKKDPDKIGRFGIGFKLAHRLVGKNEGTDELVNQYKGPILFSWSKLEDLESLLNNEPIEPLVPNSLNYQEYVNSPYLLKLLLTNFPSDPDETIRDINYNNKILFPKSELTELTNYLKENFRFHSDSLVKNVLTQGSLFFIKLGEDKKKLLDKDYSELVNGIQYSMNTLKNLKKVYINNEDIEKIPLQLEVGTIKKNSLEFIRIDPEYKDFDIRFAIGFNNLKFGNPNTYDQVKLLKEKPNFYKYFPMGDEINGFGFIVHCDSFSNEANRRKLHEDDINRNLFPELAKHIICQLAEYKFKDRNKFLNLYASLLVSDIPERQNNKWLRPIFYDILLNTLKNSIPTKNGFANNAQFVKIKKIRVPLKLSDLGLEQIEWFEWNDETEKFLIDEAIKTEKLGIKEWDIRDVIENANIEDINQWICSSNENIYTTFLRELEMSHLRKETKEKICKIKLFRFSDGNFYSFNEIIKQENNANRVIFNYNFTNLFFKTKKIEHIENELFKLEIILSEINITDYPKIFSSIERMPDEKQMYIFISEKCKTNILTAQEKKKLFLNFRNEPTKFDDVADNTLKGLELFCNIHSEIKPINKLIDYKLTNFNWLSNYKIKEEEYFPELNSFLISESEDIFKIIFQENRDEIISKLSTFEEIKSLINLYQNNQKSFFKEFIIMKNKNEFMLIEKTAETFQVQPFDKETRKFINENCTNSLYVLPYEFVENFKDEEGLIKGDELHILILELIDIEEHKKEIVDIVKYKAKHKFLSELSVFKFNSEVSYCQEDFEYKILYLACEVLKEDDYQKFKSKVIIETENKDLRLLQIPPYTDNIKIDKFELSLAKILPDNYENSDYLNSLINQFISLGLNKDRIGNLFGVSDEKIPNEIFQLFTEQVKIITNPQQLAFLILYGLYVEEIDFNLFKAINIEEEEVSLGFDKYLTSFDFIMPSETLNQKYNEIDKIFKNFPIKIEYADNLLLFKEPCFFEDKFFCPYIKENLIDREKISFIDFLYNQWKWNNKKTNIKSIDWSTIDGTSTSEILGFNPVTSVYPSKYASNSEVLPEYIINWISNEESKINFLSDIGVWTEYSVIIDLRKFLTGEINEFNNNRLAQETYFNTDETILFNTFEWLKENQLRLKTQEQFETFKSIVLIINQNRTNKGDLVIQQAFEFKELIEFSSEWEESYYENWKFESKIFIFLFEGEMPNSISLDEIENYVFYYFYEGNAAIDSDNNIYINKNADLKKQIRKLELEHDDLHFDRLWQNKLEVLEKENLQLRKTSNALLGTGFSNDISKNDQYEASREAKEIVKEKLESENFVFREDIGRYSTINGVTKDNISYPLVVKSYKYQDEPFKIGANEWIQLMQPNSMLWVHFGNRKLGCIKLNELLRKQDNLTISFSTENLEKEDRIGEFAKLLNYFRNVHFDFNSIRPDNYSRAENLNNYRFNERRNEVDLTEDDETIL